MRDASRSKGHLFDPGIPRLIFCSHIEVVSARLFSYIDNCPGMEPATIKIVVSLNPVIGTSLLSIAGSNEFWV